MATPGSSPAWARVGRRRFTSGWRGPSPSTGVATSAVTTSRTPRRTISPDYLLVVLEARPAAESEAPQDPSAMSMRDVLHKVQEKYGDRVQVLSVVTILGPAAETPDKVKAYVTSHKVTYPILFDMGQIFLRRFDQVSALPADPRRLG